VSEPASNGTISLVVPTYNRAAALRANLDLMVGLEGVSEVVIVDDGSSDDTAAVFAQYATDPRLKLVSHGQNRGVARARNTGVQAASGDWILFGEDDCRFPADYAVVLHREAMLHGADIVGAPLLHLDATDAQVPAIAAAWPRSNRVPGLDDVDVFPARPIVTPFLPARVLVRRTVFDKVRYYEDFESNGYREETDFFVQAARSGFTCLLTAETYCYQLGTWTGGQHHSSTLRYEYWTIRNNWRFLKRHGKWLSEQGYIRGPIASQLAFITGRVRIVAKGATTSRLRRLAAKLSRGDGYGAH
jgi:glycosyltransferase involved in cell wall biosynthesis